MLAPTTHADLSPYVQSLWAAPAAAPAGGGGREHVLPGACMHLAIRLDDTGLRLYRDADDARGESFGHAVVAGLRSRFYLKDAATPSRSVGALLRPGAARALFGCSAADLAGRHVRLDALWGADADRLRQRLAEAATPARQIALLESALACRLRASRAPPPPLAAAIASLRHDSDIAGLVRASSCSHRHFTALCREHIGLPPKRYAGLLRLQRALALAARLPRWADVALAAGYSDQAHFSREFRAFAGFTPQYWRAAAPRSPHHVPAPSAPR